MWYSAILLILGIACSLAWFLSNIASKHWQENWENHIKLLEDSKFGRIFMTTVSDYKNPLKPSVSRLNLKISLLVHIAWISVSIIYGKSLLEQNSVISYATWLISLFVVVLLYSSEIRSLKEIWNFVELLFLNKRYDKLFVKSGKIENIKINK